MADFQFKDFSLFVLAAVYRPGAGELWQAANYGNFDCQLEKLKVYRIDPIHLRVDDFRLVGRVFVCTAMDGEGAVESVSRYLQRELKAQPEVVTDLEMQFDDLDPEFQPEEPQPYTYEFIQYFEPLFRLELQDYAYLKSFYNLCRNLYGRS